MYARERCNQDSPHVCAGTLRLPDWRSPAVVCVLSRTGEFNSDKRSVCSRPQGKITLPLKFATASGSPITQLTSAAGSAGNTVRLAPATRERPILPAGPLPAPPPVPPPPPPVMQISYTGQMRMADRSEFWPQVPRTVPGTTSSARTSEAAAKSQMGQKLEDIIRNSLQGQIQVRKIITISLNKLCVLTF